MTYYQYEIRAADGSPPLQADVDGIVASVEPADGSWESPTLLVTELDVARNVTLSATDANGSLGDIVLEVKGVDGQGRSIEELIERAAAAGSGTTKGTKTFKSFTSMRWLTSGVDVGSDELSVGWGDVFGLLEDIESAEDLTERRQDGNADVGTIDETLQTWTLSGGNVPDGVKQFFVAGRTS